MTKPDHHHRLSNFVAPGPSPRPGTCFAPQAIWWLVAIVCLFSLVDAQRANGQVKSTRKARPANVKKAVVMEFHGPIDQQLFSYFKSRIARAKSDGVDLLILDIDSPGGLLEESLEMAHTLSSIDWAHTVAFVSGEAISGAALVSLGCDEIIIGETVLFGDIGAIYQDEHGTFQYIEAKINSYLVQEVRKLTELKGRSGDLAEAMIDKDVLLYWQPDQRPRKFKTARVDADQKPVAPWVPIEEAGAERFLTVIGSRAIELGLADEVANDREALNTLFVIDADNTTEFHRSSTDTVVFYLNLPVITGLIIVIGMIALYFELSAPGIGAGGLVAGLCASLFFWSRFMGGTGTWLEVVLFLAGVIFIIFELFIIPGFGISGILGLLMLVSSVVMASQDFVIPQTETQVNKLVTTLLMLLCSGGVVAVAAAFITRRMGGLPIFNRLILDPTSTRSGATTVPDATIDKDGKPIPQTHPDISVGDWGTAESLLRPAGRAKFNRRSFDVVSDGAFVQVGSSIKIVEIRGNRIVVAEINDLLPETTYPANLNVSDADADADSA